MAHDLFISYSSKDKIVADAACATLEAKRIRCWIAPRDAQGLQRLAETVRLLLDRLDPGASAADRVRQPAPASQGVPEAPREVPQAHPTLMARPGFRHVGVLVALAAVVLFGLYEGIFARHAANRSQPAVSVSPPLANETGVVMMATDGIWRLWAATGRRDQGYFRVLGPDRTEATGRLGTAVWVRVGVR